MVYIEMIIVFMFILAGIIMMQERVSNGPRLMISVLLFVFIGFKMATAATYTVGNTTTTQIQQVGNTTTGQVSINKGQYTYNNQQCVQNCIVYMIETPKIQYIRK